MIEPTPDLLARFRRFIRGDDDVPFTEEEWAWVISADSSCYLVLVPLESTQSDGDE